MSAPRAVTERWGWLCEDCFAFVLTEQEALVHCDEWQHSLGPCPERNAGLRMWTIHDHPLDFPEHWVVRPCRVVREELSRDGSGVIQAPRCWPFDTLEQCHEFLEPFGLTRIQQGDPVEPNIAEVWV